MVCHANTLLDLELPGEKGKHTKDEMVSLCSEFLNGGIDTTSTALQWITANVVKYPAIHETLCNEIRVHHQPRSSDGGGGGPAEAAIPEGRGAGGHEMAPTCLLFSAKLGGQGH